MRKIASLAGLVLLLGSLQIPAALALPPANEGGTPRPEAVEASAEGRELLARRSPDDIRAALQRFEQATAADANFAPAFAGLAEARSLLYDYAGAKEAALRAVALDDGLAKAHAVLGFAKLHGDWDWTGAEAELRRALELDPRDPTTHLWSAIVLEATGRADEAVAAARRAVELAPGQAQVRAGLGFRLYWARRYNEAVAELTAALEQDPQILDGALLHRPRPRPAGPLRRSPQRLRPRPAALPRRCQPHFGRRLSRGPGRPAGGEREGPPRNPASRRPRPALRVAGRRHPRSPGGQRGRPGLVGPGLREPGGCLGLAQDRSPFRSLAGRAPLRGDPAADGVVRAF